MISKIMKSYPLQVFRHRVYLPWLSMLGHFGDVRRGVVTQEIIELNDLGIDFSVGARFETISYAYFKSILMFAKNLGFDKFLDIGFWILDFGYWILDVVLAALLSLPMRLVLWIYME